MSAGRLREWLKPRTGARGSLPLRLVVLLACAVAATVVFVVLAEAVVEGNADGVDQTITLAIRRLDSPTFDHVMRTFTWIGAGKNLAVIVTLVALVCLAKRRRLLAVVLGASAGAAHGLNVLLKAVFARPRPELFDEIARPTDYSFPSGHAMSAMAVYGGIAAVIIYLYPRSRPWVVPIAAVLIVAIGVSRVYLGVHWPFDVLAGFAAGVPFVLVTVHLARDAR